MKSINLRETLIIESVKDSAGKPMPIPVWFEIILPALKRGPNPDSGVNFEEMGIIIAVIDKCKTAVKADLPVLLETDQYNLLISCIKAYRFNLADSNLHEYLKKLSNIPDVSMEQSAKKKAA